MKKLKILTGTDNPVLRTVSKQVNKFDPSLKKFVKQMKDAMIAARGIGIAAPQVGNNIRVFLVILDFGKKNERTVAMVNPKILKFSKKTEIDEEGCLSVPDIYGKVERSKSITVEFYDVDKVRYELDLKDLNAREVQHELDHLDAILFVDKMTEEVKYEEGDDTLKI